MPQATLEPRTLASVVRTRAAGEAGPLLAVLLCYAIVGSKFFHFISRYSVNLFYWDQWDFQNATLFERHSLWEIFRWQHGPHRQGLGGIISKLVDPLFHWSSRAQAFEAGVIIVIASLCALYLKRRLFGNIDYFDLAIPFLFLNRLFYEVLIVTINIAHGPMPLLLLVLYSTAWTINNPRWRYTSLLLVNFLLIHTGFGIFIGIVTPLLLALESFYLRRDGNADWKLSALALTLSVISFAVFFLNYHFDPAVTCFADRPRNPLPYLHFASLMFADFVGARGTSVVPTLIGAFLLTAIVAALIFSVRRSVSSSNDRPMTALVVAGLCSYVILFSMNAALGRICLGMEAAQASRYMPYVAAGLLGLYFAATSIRLPPARIVLRCGLLLTAAWSCFHFHDWDWLIVRNNSNDKKAWRACYLQGGSIERCTASTGFEVYPLAGANRLQEKLDFLKQRRLNLFADQK